MKILHIEYNNGTSESIENVHCVIEHDDDEISYFIGAGFTRYHALDVKSFRVEEVEHGMD